MEAPNAISDTYELRFGFPANSILCEICDNGAVVVALPNLFMAFLREVGATKLDIYGVKFSIQSYRVNNLQKLEDGPQVVMLLHESLMNDEQINKWFRAIDLLACQSPDSRRRLLAVARRKLAQLPEFDRSMFWDSAGTSNARRSRRPVGTAPKRLRRSEPVPAPISSDRRISSVNSHSPIVPAQMPQPIPTNIRQSGGSSAMAYWQQGHTSYGRCTPSVAPQVVPQPLPFMPQYSQQQPVNNQYYQQLPSFANNYANFNQRALPNLATNMISNNYSQQQLVNPCYNANYYQNIFQKQLFDHFLQYPNQYLPRENNAFVNFLDNQMVPNNYHQPTPPNYVQPNYPPPSYQASTYQALASQPSNTPRKQLQRSSTSVNPESNSLGDSFNNQAGSIQTYTDNSYGNQSVNTGLDSSFDVTPIKLQNDQDQIEDGQVFELEEDILQRTSNQQGNNEYPIIGDVIQNSNSTGPVNTRRGNVQAGMITQHLTQGPATQGQNNQQGNNEYPIIGDVIQNSNSTGPVNTRRGDVQAGMITQHLTQGPATQGQNNQQGNNEYPIIGDILQYSNSTGRVNTRRGNVQAGMITQDLTQGPATQGQNSQQGNNEYPIIGDVIQYSNSTGPVNTRGGNVPATQGQNNQRGNQGNLTVIRGGNNPDYSEGQTIGNSSASYQIIERIMHSYPGQHQSDSSLSNSGPILKQSNNISLLPQRNSKQVKFESDSKNKTKKEVKNEPVIIGSYDLTNSPIFTENTSNTSSTESNMLVIDLEDELLENEKPMNKNTLEANPNNFVNKETLSNENEINLTDEILEFMGKNEG